MCQRQLTLVFLESSVPYSIYHQLRPLSLSAIRTAPLRSLPWIVASPLSTSNCTVPRKPSRSSKSESLSLKSQLLNRSRCQSQARSFLTVSLPAAMFTLISRTPSKLRVSCSRNQDSMPFSRRATRHLRHLCHPSSLAQIQSMTKLRTRGQSHPSLTIGPSQRLAASQMSPNMRFRRKM